MEDYSFIHSYFEKINGRSLSASEKEIICGAFRKEQISKKSTLFSAGDSNTRHYYIEKGLLRMYVIDQSGKEFNVLFAREGQWIGDLGTPNVTSYYVQALEKSSVFSINEDGFQTIVEHFPELAKNIRRSYVFLQKRFVSILSKTAEENYEELVKNSPELINRLPQYHISSYLGVTPVFLSKILSRRARKKD